MKFFKLVASFVALLSFFQVNAQFSPDKIIMNLYGRSSRSSLEEVKRMEILEDFIFKVEYTEKDGKRDYNENANYYIMIVQLRDKYISCTFWQEESTFLWEGKVYAYGEDFIKKVEMNWFSDDVVYRETNHYKHQAVYSDRAIKTFDEFGNLISTSVGIAKSFEDVDIVIRYEDKVIKKMIND
ncbi:hypothetical protein [Ekhidna sp.]